MRSAGRPGGFAPLALVLVACAAQSHAGEGATSDEDLSHPSAPGAATYRVSPDGGVDWYSFNGFRRYHAECHMCHGPDGEGSTIAPPLLEPLRAMDYGTFQDIVARGLRSVGTGQQRVMRAMGDDRNVMCYLQDIYAYLKARADGALGRGRPDKHEPKPDIATQHDAACLGRN